MNQRDTEYHRALKLTTAALRTGAAVKSNLTAALRGSLNADRAYLTWAQQQLTNGCVPTSQSSAYSAATAAGAQADAARSLCAGRSGCGQVQRPRTSPVEHLADRPTRSGDCVTHAQPAPSGRCWA